MAKAKPFWVHNNPTSLQRLRIISLSHESCQLIWNKFTILSTWKEASLLLHLEPGQSKLQGILSDTASASY